MKIHRLLALIPLLLSASIASAEDILQSDTKPSPGNVSIEETGSLLLPQNAHKALWLNFYSGAVIVEGTTSRLKSALADQGFTFANSEAEALSTVNVTGYVRLYNDSRSYDTGILDLGDLLEKSIDFSKQPDTPRSDPLAFDAGVAQQATRAIRAGGGTGGVATGVGAAVVAHWLADATGLRGAINGGFRKLVGAKGNRPLLFCGADCKRTTHEVVIQLTVWQGKESKSYWLTLKQVADDIDESAVLPLAKHGLSRMLDKLAQAAKS